MEQGLALQKAIFDDLIDQMREASPGDQLHIQGYLSGNCFGDYCTRPGLDLRLRELLTFSMLLPHVGYPRTLNAMQSLNEVLPASGQA